MLSSEPHIPAVHALHLAEVAARYGVTSSQLFSAVGLREADLSEPEERLSVEVVTQLIERARILTGEPAIGILLGLQMRISAHGYLGFAAMVASTIGEALEIAVRYAPTRTNALALRLLREGEQAALVIDEVASFGSARDAVLFALMEGIRQIGQALTGRRLAGGWAEVTFPEPAYFAKFAAVADAPRVRFACAENRLLFPRGVLDVPLKLADPAAFKLAHEQCEQALAAIRDASRLSAKVRSLLMRKGGTAHSLERVADALHLSSRTLKRHLAAEGTTFKQLLDEARRDVALRLIGSDMSLDVVAERLGYSDLANFTRAFRRWTGKTPGAVRRERKPA